ncbi:unnamed protein product [Camellia sinensis]
MYPQPPFTLLQYHIFPTKLNREALKSSHPCESKLDTLLGGHPLVVTTLPKSQSASINEAYKLLGFVKGFLSVGSEEPEEDEKLQKERKDGEESFKNHICEDKKLIVHF